MAVACVSFPALAGWPWFSGYVNPGNNYRIYAWTDWDAPLWNGGIFPDTDCLGVSSPGYRVDGHVVYEADGRGNCVVIESTGSYSTNPDTAVGSIHPVSVQFGGWWQSPASAPASDLRHDWDSHFLNIVSSLVPTLIPALHIAPSGTNCLLSWSTNSPGFNLQSSTNLTAGMWTDITNSVVTLGADFTATVPKMQPAEFYRIKK